MHGDVDVLTESALLSLVEGGAGGGGGEVAGDVAGVMLGRSDWRGTRDVVITAAAHWTAEGESDGVGPGVVAPGSGLAEGGEAEDDQFGIVVRECDRIEGAVAAGLAGLEHYVGGLGQFEKQLETVSAVQVKRQRSLARGIVPPVEAAIRTGLVVEKGSVAAAEIAVRGFDLDHVGAEAGEQFAGEVALRIGAVEDADVVERSHG